VEAGKGGKVEKEENAERHQFYPELHFYSTIRKKEGLYSSYSH